MDDNTVGRTDTEIEDLLRDLDLEDLELLEPPEDTWEGIEAAIRTPDETGADETGANVIDLQSRSQRTRRVMLGIAAALLLAAIALTTYTLTRDDPEVVVAAASLSYDSGAFDPLGAHARAGAQLLVADGAHSIRIVNAALPAPEAGADLEVWLIRPDEEGNVADLVSLGVVDPADPGTLIVPADYDPTVFTVVDISVEPRDGDPSHSGRSILRGPLRNT